jgi:hypothetical protein
MVRIGATVWVEVIPVGVSLQSIGSDVRTFQGVGSVWLPDFVGVGGGVEERYSPGYSSPGAEFTQGGM